MLIDVHQDYNQLLDDDEREKDDDWSDEIDPQACCFKRNVHWWLRETAHKTDSAKSTSRSSRSISDKGSGNFRVSKRSRKSRSTKDTKSSKKKEKNR